MEGSDGLLVENLSEKGNIYKVDSPEKKRPIKGQKCNQKIINTLPSSYTHTHIHTEIYTQTYIYTHTYI